MEPKGVVCFNCIFFVRCFMQRGVCDDFAPTDEGMFIDEYIEELRPEYRSAWYRYLAENADDLFI